MSIIKNIKAKKAKKRAEEERRRAKHREWLNSLTDEQRKIYYLEKEVERLKKENRDANRTIAFMRFSGVVEDIADAIESVSGSSNDKRNEMEHQRSF